MVWPPIVVLASPAQSVDPHTCNVPNAWWSGLVFVGDLVALLLLAVRLRTCDDAFWIKNELKLTVAIGMLHVAALGALNLWLPYNVLSVHVLYLGVTLPLFFGVNLGKPLQLVYFPLTSYAVKRTVPEIVSTFAKVLAYKPARQSFEMHLMQEFGSARVSVVASSGSY